MLQLNLKIHCYTSKDGRHWSSDELRAFMDGEISHEQMMIRAKERWERMSQTMRPGRVKE